MRGLSTYQRTHELFYENGLKYNKFRISPLLFNAQRINYYKQIKALTMASTRGKESRRLGALFSKAWGHCHDV